MTLSYANVALGNQFADSLTIMENIGGGSWVDLKDVCPDTEDQFCPDPPIIVDTKMKTVTATVPYVPGSPFVIGNSMIFTIGVCPGCGPGGAGGGLAFPGSGVVLDLILPIEKLLPPSVPHKEPLPVVDIIDRHGSAADSCIFRSHGTHTQLKLNNQLRGNNCLIPKSPISEISRNSTTDNTLIASAETSQVDFKLVNKSSGRLNTLPFNNTLLFPNLGNLSLRSLDNQSLENVSVTEIASQNKLGKLNIWYSLGDNSLLVNGTDNSLNMKIGNVFQFYSSCNCLNGSRIEISIPYDESILDHSHMPHQINT